LTKYLMTFFSHPPLLHGHICTATNYVFISSAGVHLTKFSSISASFQQKCLEIFFVALEGVHLHPLHPLASGHACEGAIPRDTHRQHSAISQWFISRSMYTTSMIVHLRQVSQCCWEQQSSCPASASDDV